MTEQTNTTETTFEEQLKATLENKGLPVDDRTLYLVTKEDEEASLKAIDYLAELVADSKPQQPKVDKFAKAKITTP